MRRELVGVRGADLKDRCTSNVDALSNVFMGMESYTASLERIYDTEDGCVALRVGRAPDG